MLRHGKTLGQLDDGMPDMLIAGVTVSIHQRMLASPFTVMELSHVSNVILFKLVVGVTMALINGTFHDAKMHYF